MAIDVYVMPLWRFIAGDFSSPLEELGGLVTVITPDGVMEMPQRPGFWARWKAKRRARAEMRAVSRATGLNVRWRDEGEVVYSNQFRSGDTIRAYLWYRDRRDLLDFKDPMYGADPQTREYWSTAPDRKPTCPHLQRMDYFSDHFLPVDFPDPVVIERYLILGYSPAKRCTCSTPRALSELEPIVAELKLPRDYALTFSTEEATHMSDPLAGVKLAFDHLRSVLELSHQHALPVVFWG